MSHRPTTTLQQRAASTSRKNMIDMEFVRRVSTHSRGASTDYQHKFNLSGTNI